jgi:hypothetical protein
VCPCGRPGQPTGELLSFRVPSRPRRGTPPQGPHAGPRTTGTPLRHRLLLPVEESVASTTGSDLPQNLVPRNPKLAALLDVLIQISQSPIELRTLLRCHRHFRRRPSEAIPQPLKEIQALLWAEAIDFDRRVAHNPILSLVVLQGNDGEQLRSPPEKQGVKRILLLLVRRGSCDGRLLIQTTALLQRCAGPRDETDRRQAPRLARSIFVPTVTSEVEACGALTPAARGAPSS